MPKPVTLLALTLVLGSLAGCGLVDTGASAAASASSQAAQVREAKETEARVQRQLDAAYQQSAAQRQAAEADSR